MNEQVVMEPDLEVAKPQPKAKGKAKAAAKPAAKARAGAPKPRMRTEPVKMRVTARQMFYNSVLLEEGTVFWYWHEELPADFIAVEAAEHEQVGQVVNKAPEYDLKTPPPWTSTGYKAAHARGVTSYGQPPS